LAQITLKSRFIRKKCVETITCVSEMRETGKTEKEGVNVTRP